MEYLLTGSQMKAVDAYSIQAVGIPSMVLMERAALAVSGHILGCIRQNQEMKQPVRALCVCGTGNNGADGLAAARQLFQAGVQAEVLIAGEGAKTAEFEAQENILKNMGIQFRNNVQMQEYDFIIDAIFGIGLSRNVEGACANVIEQINEACGAENGPQAVSVDIPSGINSATGEVMGHAVRASRTVTFGYNKLGMALYPGRSYAGSVTVADIGFAGMTHQAEDTAFTYTLKDLERLPRRDEQANKGNCGKVLIAAGSENMGGAACMSAAAAYRSGCGLVKVFTHENNRLAVLSNVPEALTACYTHKEGEMLAPKYQEELAKCCEWADCIVLGPGISLEPAAACITDTVLSGCTGKTLVADADALNILSENRSLRQKFASLDARTVVTPHVGEMSRLIGRDAAYIKRNAVRLAGELARELSAVCVLKDAATVVTDGRRVYVNTSGNSGMATGGSGDVLTGIMAGMLCAGFADFREAVEMAVYVHGLAGDACAGHYGRYGMKACDLPDAAARILAGAEQNVKEGN